MEIGCLCYTPHRDIRNHKIIRYTHLFFKTPRCFSFIRNSYSLDYVYVENSSLQLYLRVWDKKQYFTNNTSEAKQKKEIAQYQQIKSIMFGDIIDGKFSLVKSKFIVIYVTYVDI